jgi:TPP-dependent pyruvate/acetoin dehydrogenase alpha subunit
LDEIEARVEEEVVKAVEFAETSPEPADGRIVYGYLRDN